MRLQVQSPKHRLQQLFQRFGVHQRLRASFLYDVYWGVADKRLVEDRRRELVFYRELLDGLRQDELVFDIGANNGTKTDIFLRLGARVIAVEPDELNQKILREKFHKLRLKQKPVHIIGKAVSDKIATETMLVDGPGSALNTLSRKWAESLQKDKSRFAHTQDKCDFSEHRIVETTTLDQLIATFGEPFYLKIDVEGHEISALRGLHRRVRFLSFEVNLPEFRLEGLECIKLLGRLEADGKFNYTADCRQGLALAEWIDAATFLPTLERCSESAVEVFWKTRK
jgi:FkbM family methyltransferase